MVHEICDISKVKEIAQNFSAWVPLISATVGTVLGGVITGVVTFMVSRQNHLYAREREEKAAEDRKRHEQKITEAKNEKELLLIATELVFHMEHFAELCANVAADVGYKNNTGMTQASVVREVLSLNDISGDWRVLPRKLMYRIRELPVLQSSADRAISFEAESDSPPDFERTFYEKQYQYARLGLKTIILARRLRKLAGFPNTLLDATRWSAQPILWQVWREERKRRVKAAADFSDIPDV